MKAAEFGGFFNSMSTYITSMSGKPDSMIIQEIKHSKPLHPGFNLQATKKETAPKTERLLFKD